jgi:hypothetical protein
MRPFEEQTILEKYIRSALWHPANALKTAEEALPRAVRSKDYILAGEHVKTIRASRREIEKWEEFLALYEAQFYGPKSRPRIVCLCGSTRFLEAFQQANLTETLGGKIVLSIGCNTKSDTDLMAAGELTEDLKRQLDELHKRKIDLADEILVLNVGGYVGDSTRSEIEYAIESGKSVRWLEPDKVAE